MGTMIMPVYICVLIAGKLSTSRPNTPGSSTPVTRPSTPSTPTALPTRRTTPRRLHNSPPHVVTNGRTKRPPIHHGELRCPHADPTSNVFSLEYPQGW